MVNAALVATSNLYTTAPTEPPVAVALFTRNVGHPAVVEPLAGAMGVGAFNDTCGPSVNFAVGLNTPVVPALFARACQ